MSDSTADRASAKQTMREFETLMDEFETLRGEELDELSSFLVDFTRMEARESPTRPEFRYEEAQSFLDEFQGIWFSNLEENAETSPILNIWKIADLGLDEVRNCRVLKWLLDPAETYCQGTPFLNSFLEVIGEPYLLGKDTDVQVRRGNDVGRCDR